MIPLKKLLQINALIGFFGGIALMIFSLLTTIADIAEYDLQALKYALPATFIFSILFCFFFVLLIIFCTVISYPIVKKLMRMIEINEQLGEPE